MFEIDDRIKQNPAYGNVLYGDEENFVIYNTDKRKAHRRYGVCLIVLFYYGRSVLPFCAA